MDKRDILEPFLLSYWDSHHYENALTEEGNYIEYNNALQAMDEHAMNQCIKFALYIRNEGYRRDEHSQLLSLWIKDDKTYTTKEIFKEFNRINK